MVAAPVKRIEAKDLIPVTDKSIVYVSKVFPLDEKLQPAFGQEVEIDTAAASGATTLSVLPLIEPIPAGTTLLFGTVTVTTTQDALRNAIQLRVNATPSAIVSGAKATTTGIEQTVTLSGAVAVGAKSITVNALNQYVEKDRVLTFEPSGISVKVAQDAPLGATKIRIKAAELAIPTGETCDLPNYEILYSVNSLKVNHSGDVLKGGNFQTGGGTAKAVISRDSTASLSGEIVFEDMGFSRLKRCGNGIGIKLFFISIPDKGDQDLLWAHVGNWDKDKTWKQFEKCNFSLEVDGSVEEGAYPV